MKSSTISPPSTDTDAIEKLRKISSTDQSMASFAVREFEIQRAMGESVQDAYNKIVVMLLRIGG